MIPAFTIIFKRPDKPAPLGSEAKIGIKFLCGKEEYGSDIYLGFEPSDVEIINSISLLLLRAEIVTEFTDKQEE